MSNTSFTPICECAKSHHWVHSRECSEWTAIREHPKPGETWRHYEGGEYFIVDLGVLEASHAIGVVYKQAGNSTTWIRHLWSFMEVLSDNTPRFEKVFIND